MKKEMKTILENLLTVKSIVTLVLTVVFSILSVYDRISGEQFLNIFSVVIAFYFGTQYQKGEQKNDEPGTGDLCQNETGHSLCLRHEGRYPDGEKI